MIRSGSGSGYFIFRAEAPRCAVSISVAVSLGYMVYCRDKLTREALGSELYLTEK